MCHVVACASRCLLRVACFPFTAAGEVRVARRWSAGLVEMVGSQKDDTCSDEKNVMPTKMRKNLPQLGPPLRLLECAAAFESARLFPRSLFCITVCFPAAHSII